MLGTIGPGAVEAIPELAHILTSDDGEREQVRAATALGKIGPAAVPALADALGDEDHSVRGLAARALGEIGPKAVEAVPALDVLRDDPNRDVRGAVREAIAQINSPG